MMKQLIGLLFLLMFVSVKAQILPMGDGTGQPIDCAAADTSGQVYTLKYTYADTCIMQRWSPLTKKWTLLPTVKKTLDPQFLIPDCHFLSNNQMVVAGVNDTGKFAIYTVNGSTWNRIGVFLDNNLVNRHWEKVRLYKFKNVVYLVTTIDSVIGYPKSKVYQVNSNGLVSMGFKVESPEYHLAMKGDTLAISANNSVYYYSAGVWTRYYTSPHKISNTIRGLTGVGSYLYVTENQSTISKILFGSKMDSISTKLDRPSLSTIGNRVFLSIKPLSTSITYDVYSFISLKQLERNLRFKYRDSFPLRYITNKNKVYIYGNDDLWFNKFNCHGIAEMDQTVLAHQQQDTIIMRTFIDHNQNNKYDAGDVPLSVPVIELYGFTEFQTGTTDGTAVYYPLANEDVCFRPIDGVRLDSCYSLTYSSAICSQTFNTSSTTHIIDFAYKGKSNSVLDVRVRTLVSGRQRIDQNFNSTYIVYREGCNQSAATAVKFHIDLAPGTEYINSIPAYKSKIGNRLYYELSVGFAEEKHVVLSLKYPFSNFSLNQRVCHKAYIEQIAGEDTTANRDSIVHRCVYSYDPNAKYSVPEGKVYSGIKMVRYHIDFQNEGNDYADRVRVVDTLNVNIPVYEFRMRGASHAYKVSSNGNVLTWTFEDIGLAPKSLSEAGSKGYIEFDAMVKSDLRVGDSIYNNAMIYFDLNEPIRTKNATIIRASKDNGIEEIGNSSIKVYPNPGSTYIYIEGEAGEVYTIYNSIGQRIGEWESANGVIKVETGKWSRGIYLITDKSSRTEKIVIE